MKKNLNPLEKSKYCVFKFCFDLKKNDRCFNQNSLCELDVTVMEMSKNDLQGAMLFPFYMKSIQDHFVDRIL